MKIKLSYWQILLLFMPLIIGIVMMEIPTMNGNQFFDLLASITFCLVIYYQTFLALAFNETVDSKSKVFKINALIPVVFNTLHLLYLVYSSVRREMNHYTKPVRAFNGPLRTADFNVLNYIVVFLLMHFLITFFFINNQFVSRRIRLLSDGEQKTQLGETYLKPMKMLVVIAASVITALITINLVSDFIHVYKN